LAGAGRQDGSAVVDLGAPLADDHSVAGCSILDADSQQTVMGLLAAHPDFHTPGGQIEVHEMLRPPRM
jgi:hypothetical protein